MHTLRRTALALTLPALNALIGCTTSDEMSSLEALEALQETNQSARGQQATAEVVEISTDFTIGDAIESAAETIAEFWESQADCTEVTLSGNTATINYGTLDDPCVYEGHTYAGLNTITVESTEAGALEVWHSWAGFTNGEVSVDGAATVTWSGEEQTRRVVTDHTWSDSNTGEIVDVYGDHVEGRLDESLSVWESGFTLDGIREWTGESGDWSLDMSELELRMIDPAPQAGSLIVESPEGKSLEILYERVDEDTIQATLIGLRGGDRVYHISSLGVYEEVEAD